MINTKYRYIPFYILLISFYSCLQAEEKIMNLRKIYSSKSSNWPKANVDKEVNFKELKAISKVDKNILNKPIVNLGKRLFNEVRLSKNNDISCATCHSTNNAFIQNTKVSVGHNNLVGTRNAPTLYGLKNDKSFFWDGRQISLEDQALDPITNPVEMALSKEELEEKIKKLTGYEKELKTIYRDTTFTTKRLAQALAAFERTLTSPKTRFDLFLEGDTNALNDSEILGLHLFRTKARCVNCHHGENLNDGKFHNLGLTFYGRQQYEDFGLYNTTLENKDMGKFKTPTLRQISKTFPYMHNGFFSNLKALVNTYNEGMFHPKPKKYQINDPRFPVTSKHLKKLNLSKKEKAALLSFLRTL